MLQVNRADGEMPENAKSTDDEADGRAVCLIEIRIEEKVEKDYEI